MVESSAAPPSSLERFSPGSTYDLCTVRPRDTTPRVTPGGRDSYLPEFDAIAAAENFLTTAPPGPIDLLFIDSVRYTHLAILRAASPWLRRDTVVLMEDDIPEYGELATVRSDFEVRDVVDHGLAGHPWPLVELKLVL